MSNQEKKKRRQIQNWDEGENSMNFLQVFLSLRSWPIQRSSGTCEAHWGTSPAKDTPRIASITLVVFSAVSGAFLRFSSSLNALRISHSNSSLLLSSSSSSSSSSLLFCSTPSLRSSNEIPFSAPPYAPYPFGSCLTSTPFSPPELPSSSPSTAEIGW